jgi:hypothetical protein
MRLPVRSYRRPDLLQLQARIATLERQLNASRAAPDAAAPHWLGLLDHERATRAESEELFRLLVESVQDYAISTLNPAGHVVSWSAALCAARLR